MAYDYEKLISLIVKQYGKRSTFAQKVGISEHTLSMKLNSKIYFKQNEIVHICNELGIPAEEIPAYFFALKVQ